MFEMSKSVSFDNDSLDDLIPANAVMENYLFDDLLPNLNVAVNV